jgi:hypothetical protein
MCRSIAETSARAEQQFLLNIELGMRCSLRSATLSIGGMPYWILDVQGSMLGVRCTLEMSS